MGALHEKRRRVALAFNENRIAADVSFEREDADDDLGRQCARALLAVDPTFDQTTCQRLDLFRPAGCQQTVTRIVPPRPEDGEDLQRLVDRIRCAG